MRIISLLRLKTLDVKFLRELLHQNGAWEETLREAVKESVEEYSMLGLDPWKGRKSMWEVLRRIL